MGIRIEGVTLIRQEVQPGTVYLELEKVEGIPAALYINTEHLTISILEDNVVIVEA